MRRLFRDARTAWGLFRLTRQLERGGDFTGATLELMSEPQWSLDQRAELERLRGQPEPERAQAWQVLHFKNLGTPAAVGRGATLSEAVRAALAATPPPMPVSR